MTRPCKHCGSVFPHVRFADGCEWLTARGDMACKCACGSVKFCLLKSGEVECSKCATKQKMIWRQG